jgi:isopentenyl-diphosphate delta-isomerase
MGFDCELKHLFAFEYRAEFENGLTEHEYDHVFIGKYEDNPSPNPDEVENYQWISWADLQIDLKQNPSKYTAWLHILMDRYFDKFL